MMNYTLKTIFLQKQTILKVYHIDSKINDHELSLIHQIHEQQFIRVLQLDVSFADPNMTLLSDMQEEIMEPSSAIGYLIVSSSIYNVLSSLKYLAEINTNGRWLFILINVKRKSAENLLQSAWKEQRMLNLIIFLAVEIGKVFQMKFLHL